MSDSVLNDLRQAGQAIENSAPLLAKAADEIARLTKQVDTERRQRETVERVLSELGKDMDGWLKRLQGKP